MEKKLNSSLVTCLCYLKPPRDVFAVYFPIIRDFWKLSSEVCALPAISSRDVTTLVSHFSFSPPLHTRWSSTTSVWLQPISPPIITALFLLQPLYLTCDNNVTAYAGIFWQFRVLARSVRCVTSLWQGYRSDLTVWRALRCTAWQQSPLTNRSDTVTKL